MEAWNQQDHNPNEWVRMNQQADPHVCVLSSGSQALYNEYVTPTPDYDFDYNSTFDYSFYSKTLALVTHACLCACVEPARQTQ